MATPGQPTSYKPEYDELAHNYCLLGATNEVLGDFFGVTSRTIDNWIATHPDFADAVYRGRAVADAVVVRALFERAKGFSHQVSRTTLYRGKEQTVTNTVSYPPDTQACMFWLRNRQRQYWQARAEATPGRGRRRHGGAARRCRREHVPCWRLSARIGVSLAEIAGIGFRRFCRSGHHASIRAIFTYSVHLARLWPPADGPWAFRVARAMRHS